MTIHGHPKWPGRPKDKRKVKKGAPTSVLYDLEVDIGEKTNVASDHPEVVARLRAYAEAFQKELTQNTRPAGTVADPKPLRK